MALTYQLETKNGNLQVRARKPVIRNGKAITGKLHRHVISPGDDYSNEPGKVRRHCKKLFTPARIRAYKVNQKAIADGTFTKPLKDVDHVETITLEDDTVLICKCTELYEAGEYYPQHHDRIKVEPGVPVTNAPAIVTDILAAAHIPVVVDKHEAQETYKAAKQARQEAVAAREDAKEAKVEWFQKRALAKAAYDKAVLSEVQTDIDAALVAKQGAMSAHAAAVKAVDKATVAVTTAQAAMATAKTLRDKARADHKAFIDAEG